MLGCFKNKMKKQKRRVYTIVSLLILLVFIGGILLGRYYLAQRANTLAQSVQCNTELQNWQKRMKDDPNEASFQDIKIYKAAFSNKYNDCVVATYLALPAASSVGEDTEWLEIDSLSIKGVTYWSQTYTHIMPDAEATKILDTQLAELQ